MVLIPRTADFALQKIYEVSFVEIWTEGGGIASKLRGKKPHLKKGDCAVLYVGPLKVDTSTESSHVIPCPLMFPIGQVLQLRFALLCCIPGI